MKKIVLLIIFLISAVISFSQPIGNQQENNITIKNDAPTLHLRGEGAVINFYNGDLRLIRSSNILTLSGGIFKIGNDTTATQAYVRTHGGGGIATGLTSPFTLGGTSVTATGLQLNYSNTLTSNIQTQINEKEARIDSTVAVLADSISLKSVASMLAPDTVQHTANYTVAASDWGKDQHCLKATSILITIPANLTDWPVGGVMNFYGEGAGIMVFKASGVTFISDSDSIATSRKGQAVSVKKIATNKYWLIGTLTD